MPGINCSEPQILSVVCTQEIAGSRRDAAHSWKQLESEEVGSNLDNVEMSPHPALEAGPGDRQGDQAVRQQLFHTCKPQRSPPLGVTQIKTSGCDHRAAWSEGGTPMPWGTPSNLQSPTQALHYKSQDGLAQGLDSAPGCGQRCPWVSAGDGASPATWVSVSAGDGFLARGCTGALVQLVWYIATEAKNTVWAQCWVGINFACVTGCTTFLERL